MIVRGLRLTSLLPGKPSPWRPGPLPQRRIVNSCRQRPGSLGRGPRARARRGSGRHAEAPFERKKKGTKKEVEEEDGEEKQEGQWEGEEEENEKEQGEEEKEEEEEKSEEKQTEPGRRESKRGRKRQKGRV